MLRTFWDKINDFIYSILILDYRFVVMGICIYWFWFTTEVPTSIPVAIIKDVYSLLASIMATLIGLFIAILVIALGFKGKSSFRIISFEGLLQIGLWLFWSLLFSVGGYIYSVISNQNQPKIAVFFIVSFAILTIMRLLDLTRTTIIVILQKD